jgi:hypothetical protein
VTFEEMTADVPIGTLTIRIRFFGAPVFAQMHRSFLEQRRKTLARWKDQLPAESRTLAETAAELDRRG